MSKLRDLASYTPLEPEIVARLLRSHARALARTPLRGTDSQQHRGNLIRALMRGALDCETLSDLKNGITPEMRREGRRNAIRAGRQAAAEARAQAKGYAPLVTQGQRDALTRAKEQAAEAKARASAGWQTAAAALLIKK